MSFIEWFEPFLQTITNTQIVAALGAETGRTAM